MPRILALETSGLDCSVAVSDGTQQCLDHRHLPQAHTRHLLPMVDDLLRKACIDKARLDAIAFGCGPGSFTGLRICASFAQGLAVGLDIPLLPVSSLQILAQTVADQQQFVSGERLCCLFDARMDQIYWGEYALGDDGLMQARDEDRLVVPEAVNSEANAAAGQGLVYGERIPVYDQFQRRFESAVPSADSLLSLATQQFQQGLQVSAELAQPVYLRGKSAWL